MTQSTMVLPPKETDPGWWRHRYLVCRGCKGAAAILDHHGERWAKCVKGCQPMQRVKVFEQ